jgi:Uma2 family endonuclease
MPRVASNAQPIGFEQYMILEEQHEIRHEFVNGFMYPMAYETKIHNLIAGNVFYKIKAASRAKPNCAAYMENVKLRIPNGVGYYPDVVVSCDDDVNDLLIHKPCLIVEVLSNSTENLDRSEKWLNYQKSASLKMCVLIHQNKKLLETFKRNTDGTWQYAILEETGTLEFACLEFSMTLEEIYEDVKLEEES